MHNAKNRDRLIRAGAAMSNPCFNLRQREGECITKGQAEVMTDAFKEWDAALREYRKPKERTDA